MLEVAAVEDRQPIQALPADGADEPLGDRVRLRCPHRRLDDPDAFAAETSSKGPLYLLSRSRTKKRTPLSLKSRPRSRACWVTHSPVGAAGEPDSATRVRDEEEHVEATEQDRLDGEEVAGDDAARL